MFCTLFSLNQGRIPLRFPSKVFNEADYHTKGCCTLFPSLEFFPIGFFTSKGLMMHILDGHARGSVMNIISGCRYNNWLLGHTISLLGHIVLAPQVIDACS
jgi:hypothetical protein